MKDTQITFYYQLGLLATSFSKLEEKTRWLLICLIDSQDPTGGLYLIEQNSLYVNLELIKKLNRLRNFEQELINKLIERITNLRQTRNSFIHGVWGEAKEKDGEIIIDVQKHKVRYVEEEDGESWYHQTTEIYSLNQLIQMTNEIQEISKKFQILIKTFYEQRS